MACPQHSTPAPEGAVVRFPGIAPAAFIADLFRADLSVLAYPSGRLELLAYRTRLNRDGNGYDEVPHHPDADALAVRFDALTERERAGIAVYVRGLSHSAAA